MSAQADTPAPKVVPTTAARMFVEFVIPLLVAAIGLPLVGGVYLIATGDIDAVGSLSTGSALLLRLAEAVPAVLLALCIVALRKVLLEYERGQFLSVVATTSFERVGAFALVAILAQVVGVPALRAALLGEWRLMLDYTMFDVSLLLFGALLSMVGAVFGRAAVAIKAENDEIV
ncbi:MAG: hypothetical protein FJW21_02355 [Acidimicrobiia bacterium]|nr:hypothetical protein [Acidimicrobiia bacterium]